MPLPAYLRSAPARHNCGLLRLGFLHLGRRRDERAARGVETHPLLLVLDVPRKFLVRWFVLLRGTAIIHSYIRSQPVVGQRHQQQCKVRAKQGVAERPAAPCVHRAYTH